MAVMKINNDKDYITGKSKYKDQNALQNVYQYLIDQKNTGKSKKIQNHYIGGSHVDLSNPVGSMEEVAQKFHKASGIRLKHIIISFAEDEIETYRMQEQFSNIYQFFANQNGTTRAIVWQKSNPSPMNGEYVYLSGVELAVWHKNRGGQFNARCKNTVFKYPNGTSKLHPTEKNHALLTELILDNSNLGQIVFDPCMGSGAHGIVALENGRNFIGIELDDKYFSIAKERIAGVAHEV